MKCSTTLLIAFSFFSLTLFSQKNSNKKANEPSPSTVSLENIIRAPSDNYVITKDHVSSISGIHHYYLRQAINGIEVQGTESSVHIDKNGKAISEHNKFLENINATVKNSTVSITAEQAIRSVATQMSYPITNLTQVKSEGGINKKAVFNKAGISSEEIPVKLLYYYQERKGTTLVWELSIAETTSSDWWNFRVDAATGQIIDKDNWTISCNIIGEHDHKHTANSKPAVFIGPMPAPVKNNITTTSNTAAAPPASYNVYAMPVESPFFGSRSVVSNPENLTASPFGWHDTNGADGAEFTNTRGNNVSAYDDDDNNNLPDNRYAFSPGGNLVFDFPLNTTYSGGDQSESAAITNLFYWSNIIHDVMYQYGFDEASGNFQENNYGNGGVGADSVNAESQDGSGTCNANFSTPGDGNNPRMQMYVCSDKDGDLDNWVIIHEYGHGISNRLNSLGGEEQMGEGWSDFYGLLLTMEAGAARETPRGFGSYAFFSIFGNAGARTQPYSTDFTVNNFTYDSIKTEVAPHGVGSVWAEMLWEMTWELIDLHGFSTDFYNGTGGNNVALGLVTEGLKLQPANAGFVDGRDAILLADQTMYGGANQCTIWDAFARRGLGFSAVQGSSASKADGTEAFDLPPNFASFDTIDEVCLASGIQTGLSGGLPLGGIYSGLGVTDDGNGNTYTLDPSVNGEGVVTISYLVNDFCTGGPVTLTEDINITNTPPVIICNGSGPFTGTREETISPGLFITDGAPLISTLTVLNNEIITDLNVALDISHTYIGDLFITLESPTGTVITIFDPPNNCSGNNFRATLDDEAAITSTGCYGSNSAEAYPDPSYQPFSSFSVFDGENTAGDWILSITDIFGADDGTLINWKLNYEYDIVAPPVMLSLDAFGLATINAEDLLFSVTTECGGFTVLAGDDPAATVSFNCANVGANNVEVIVTNDEGASSMCTAIVIVDDPFTVCNCPSYTEYTATGWSNGLPDINKGAIISIDYNTGSLGDINSCSLTVANNATLTIEANTYVNIENNIINEGSILVEHQGSIVQVDDNALVANNSIIEVDITTPFLKPRDFTILGSPMTTEMRTGVYASAFRVLNHFTLDFFPHPDVASYYLPNIVANFMDDNFNDWTFYSGAINPAEGYIVYPQASLTDGNTTYDLTYSAGTLNNGVIEYAMDFHNDKNSSPNMLANPYASAIDAKKFLEQNLLIDEVYFWEHLTTPSATFPGGNNANFSMEDISMYNLVGGIGTGTQAENGGDAPNGFIATSQGFGVKANAAGMAQFNNSMRLTTGNTTLRTPLVNVNRIWLTVENEANMLATETLIAFTPQATLSFDAGYDSEQLGKLVSLYSHLPNGEMSLGIQSRETFDPSLTVPLGFTTLLDDSEIYTISISNMDGEEILNETVYLKDNLTDTVIILSEAGTYTFSAGKGVHNERFTLQFMDEDVLNTESNLIGNVLVYPNPTNGGVNISSPNSIIEKVVILDILGRIVLTNNNVNANNTLVDLSNMNSAVYFIEIYTEKGNIVKRILKE